MEKNVGTMDRVIRFIIAAACLYLFFTGTVTGALAVAALVLAGVCIVTGAFARCPLYRCVGMRTCPVQE